MTQFLRFAIAALMVLTWPVLAEAQTLKVTPQLLQTWLPMEQRLRNIFHRISVSNMSLCKKQSAQDGMLVRIAPGPLAPDFRAASVAAYGLGKYPKIGLIVPNSPAALAGFQLGDEVLSLNGNMVPDNLATEMDAKIWTSSATALKDAWALAGRSPPVTVVVLRDGRQHSISLNAKMGCDLNAYLTPSRAINASNTGTNIWATTGLFEMTPDDHEVAFVLAHEAAHSILGHVRPQNQKTAQGQAARRTMEIDADQLGVQLMATAGYDPYAAARFQSRWNKLGRGAFEKLTGELFIRRLVSPKDRVALLQKRAEEVDPDRKLATQADAEGRKVRQ
jgi:hypothetical protein